MRALWTNIKMAFDYLKQNNHAAVLTAVVGLLTMIGGAISYMASHIPPLSVITPPDQLSPKRDLPFKVWLNGNSQDPLRSVVESLRQNRSLFQVRIHHGFSGARTLCAIQNINIDKNSETISISFAYMGEANLNLTRVASGARKVSGWYKTKSSTLGGTTAMVELEFNPDGSAGGKWHDDSGASGRFDIIRLDKS